MIMIQALLTCLLWPIHTLQYISMRGTTHPHTRPRLSTSKFGEAYFIINSKDIKSDILTLSLQQ